MTRPNTTLLSALVAPLETGFVELRPIATDGSGAGASEWFPVEEHARACERAITLSADWNCYFGVVPRREHGGRGAADVGMATTVWADLDSAEAVAACHDFAVPPTARYGAEPTSTSTSTGSCVTRTTSARSCNSTATSPSSSGLTSGPRTPRGS